MELSPEGPALGTDHQIATGSIVPTNGTLQPSPGQARNSEFRKENEIPGFW